VHVLPGIGHVPQVEAPETTAALLLPFLDALALDLRPAGQLPAAGSTDSLAGAS
jgi:hypothetical protein